MGLDGLSTGLMPPAENNGVRFAKIPIDAV